MNMILVARAWKGVWYASASFSFDGSVDELTAAYDRLGASLPPDSLQLHIIRHITMHVPRAPTSSSLSAARSSAALAAVASH